MNKVICDICGTTYPETAEQCPICGFARDMGAVFAETAPAEEMPAQAPARQQVKGGRFSASNVRKRNNSTPRYQAHLVDDEDEEYVPTPAPRTREVPKPSGRELARGARLKESARLWSSHKFYSARELPHRLRRSSLPEGASFNRNLLRGGTCGAA